MVNIFQHQYAENPFLQSEDYPTPNLQKLTHIPRFRVLNPPSCSNILSLMDKKELS